jgi:hypothetical protein
MTKWLLRPSLLIALSVALVAGGLFLVLHSTAPPVGPVPLPVGDGEQEIAWLYTATGASAWERFVAAAKRADDRLQEDFPGAQTQVTAATFPRHTTATPEVSLSIPSTGRRLVFRWYKLTSNWKTRDWVEALLHRQPPPLAIIGGSSSDAARELALNLADLTTDMPEAARPLLLLTTATADRVPPAPDGMAGSASTSDEPDGLPGIALNSIYAGRTFRFCFTNRQMASAVTHFIWTQDDLRPDSDPAYMVQWEDDSYSRDLVGGFVRALREQVALLAAQQWAWVTADAAASGWTSRVGGGFFPIDLAGPDASRFRLDQVSPPQPIDSSVGGFSTPNPYEARVARDLLDLLQGRAPPQERPLLVVTGQAQPSRRLLRGLMRLSPDVARRFVVAGGDAISFNTVYRDRKVAWPIQDLPFRLVFFCHHNPVDRAAGFRPNPRGGLGVEGDGLTATTGTEDILLFGDIIEALVEAGGPDAATVTERLASARLRHGQVVLGDQGVPLFGPHGERQSGTGEHVVCVRPRFRDDRTLPESSIEVWAWRRRPSGGYRWQRTAGSPLTAYYDEYASEGGGHGSD